jgi:hypothetical protein
MSFRVGKSPDATPFRRSSEGGAFIHFRKILSEVESESLIATRVFRRKPTSVGDVPRSAAFGADRGLSLLLNQNRLVNLERFFSIRHINGGADRVISLNLPHHS